jgi:hypothetical protein
LAVGVDVPLERIEYSLRNDDGTTVGIFTSWPVHPVGRLGLSAGFF